MRGLNLALLLSPSASSYGPRIDHLYYLILWITGGVFLLTEAALILFSIRYRRQEGKKAFYSHGSTRAEVIWTLIPAAILVALGFMSQALWSDLRVPKNFPQDAAIIRVLAEQCGWHFTYPGPDKMFGTCDDIAVDGDFHVPVVRTVRFDLSSQDVIHGFYLPAMRVHQDTVPGMTIPVWVTPTRKGTYDLRCTQFCGTNHYQMKGQMIVDDPADYEAWLAGAKANAF